MARCAKNYDQFGPAVEILSDAGRRSIQYTRLFGWFNFPDYCSGDVVFGGEIDWNRKGGRLAALRLKYDECFWFYCRHLNSPFDQKQLPQGTELTKQSCSKSSLYTLSQGVTLQSEQVE